MVSALRTTASVPPVALPNMVSKLARRVSPMTSVPARKATPRSTARKVPAKRRLWARREEALRRSEARAMTPPVSVAAAFMTAASKAFMRSRTRSAVGASIRSTSRPSARKTTSSAWAAATGSWVTMTTVRSVSRTARPSRPQHLLAGAGVEVAGGLVGEDDVGPAGEGAGHGDALLLAAGELARPVVQPVAQADDVDEGVDPLPVGPRRPPGPCGSVMFSATVSVGTRLNAWKTKPIAVAAQQGQPPVVERAQVGVADEGGARR